MADIKHIPSNRIIRIVDNQLAIVHPDKEIRDAITLHRLNKKRDVEFAHSFNAAVGWIAIGAIAFIAALVFHNVN